MMPLLNYSQCQQANLPKFKGLFVLRVHERKYGIPEFISFFLDDALKKGLPADQPFPPAQLKTESKNVRGADV